MRPRARQPFGQIVPRVTGLGVGLMAAMSGTPGRLYGSTWPTSPVAATSLTNMYAGNVLYRDRYYAMPVGSVSSGGWGVNCLSGGVPANTGAVTMAGLVYPLRTGTGTEGLLLSSTTGAFPMLRFFQGGGAGSDEFAAYMRQGDGTYLTVPTGDTTLKPRFAVARLRADDRLELWVDGAYVGYTAHARNGYNTSYSTGVLLHAYYSQYCRVALGYVWNRWIADDELYGLMHDPMAPLYASDPLDGLDVGIISGSYQYARPNSDIVTTGWSIAATGPSIDDTTLYIDWENGTYASDVFTPAAPNKPTTYTLTGGGSIYEETDSPWNGRYVFDSTAHWSHGLYTDSLPAGAVPSSQGRLLIELEPWTGDGGIVFELKATSGATFIRVNKYDPGTGVTLRLHVRWDDTNYCEAEVRGMTYPTGPAVVECIWDTNNVTASLRARARTWALGGTPPAFTDANATAGDASTQATITTLLLCEPNNNSLYTRIGRIIVTDDIALDLSEF